MNPTMYQFLATDHARTLHERASAVQPVTITRQPPTAPADGRARLAHGRFAVVRRFVHRWAAA